ncbi:MAG: energy transducer TonB [Flavobacteriales bacterium]
MSQQALIKEMDEIVFEKRNKDYGAYQLRKKYNRNMNTALAIALAVYLLIVFIPAIKTWLSDLTSKVELDKNVEVTLVEPPPLNKDEPPPPPPPPDPPPPVQETIKFTPPVVTEEPIKDEDIPPPQEELKETNVGRKTQEGSGEVFDLPVEGEGKGIVDDAPQQIYTFVEQMPEFPGGEEELFKYLSKNIKYPAMARESGLTGTVYVTFVVEGDGKITDVKILRGIGGGCDQEALRVVQNMPPWKSGKQNGRPVRVQCNLPIKFTLK